MIFFENALIQRSVKSISKKNFSLAELDTILQEEESNRNIICVLIDKINYLSKIYSSLHEQAKIAFDAGKEIKKNDEFSETIRAYYESILAIRRFAKIFVSNEENRSFDFYDKLESSLENIQAIVELNNCTRSYVTRKNEKAFKKELTCLGKISLFIS